jgi:hypothetical protein
MGARPITGAIQNAGAGGRPMTAVRAAGYTSAGKSGRSITVEHHQPETDHK